MGSSIFCTIRTCRTLLRPHARRVSISEGVVVDIMVWCPTWKVACQGIDTEKPSHPWIVVAGTVIIIPRFTIQLLRIKLVRRTEAGAPLIDEDLAECHVLLTPLFLL